LQIADWRLQISNCRFRIADFELPIWLPISDCRFPIADFGLRFRIVDFIVDGLWRISESRAAIGTEFLTQRSAKQASAISVGNQRSTTGHISNRNSTSNNAICNRQSNMPQSAIRSRPSAMN
jgi:hypothetical protein